MKLSDYDTEVLKKDSLNQILNQIAKRPKAFQEAELKWLLAKQQKDYDLELLEELSLDWEQVLQNDSITIFCNIEDNQNFLAELEANTEVKWLSQDRPTRFKMQSKIFFINKSKRLSFSASSALMTMEDVVNHYGYRPNKYFWSKDKGLVRFHG